MTHTVKLSKAALDYFRTLSRNSEVEIESYLVGDIISPTLVRIDYFCYPKKYHTQTVSAVAWYQYELDGVKTFAESKGKKIVGTIHSHPQWDCVPSKTDYYGQITEGLRILGICSTMGRKTRVRFWVSDCCLPCEIDYV